MFIESKRVTSSSSIMCHIEQNYYQPVVVYTYSDYICTHLCHHNAIRFGLRSNLHENYHDQSFYIIRHDSILKPFHHVLPCLLNCKRARTLLGRYLRLTSVPSKSVCKLYSKWLASWEHVNWPCKDVQDCTGMSLTVPIIATTAREQNI